MNIYSENKKATYDYEVIEKYQAGLVLQGHEVKSIKGGHINLSGSYVVIRGNEPYLIGAKVPAYQPKNAPKDYDSLRNRKILLTKKEIAELAGSEKNKSLTIVPISVYNKNRKIKVEVSLVKGKKKRDKREAIKRRETDREIRREIKER